MKYAIIKTFIDKVDIYSFLEFSDLFSNILLYNSFDKYFKVLNCNSFHVEMISVEKLQTK
jgi:hypothetical protein